MKRIIRRTFAPALLSATFAMLPCVAAPEPLPNPDFTKGDPVPPKAKHDWTLGATGARGWIYCDMLVTTDARQILITKVEKHSPADGVLNVGDVILGVAGKQFSHDPRTEFGVALTHAESEVGDGALQLTRWRGGTTEEVTVTLPILGTYGATAPFDCPKSKRILEQCCEALALRIKKPEYAKSQNPITRSLNALAILAGGNREHLPLVAEEARWAADFKVDGMQTWHYGYVITLLSEYVMATGDVSVMPGLSRLALEAARGQSGVGSWGHRFAKPDGRLFGYGMMNAPGVPLTISLVMARTAGIKEPDLDRAIDRSGKLLRFYIGKGAIPYGDHIPWMENHDDNGKCGMGAVLFDLLGDSTGATFFSRMSLASHGAERDTGHTGNFWNIAWAMPGVVRSGPQATGAWMAEFGAWYFDLARGWDGSFRHQGPPEPNFDSTGGWDATGAYLLAYAMPLKKLLLTGRQPSNAPPLDTDAAKRIVLDGRGWSNKDRHSFYDQLGGDQLLERLGSWSPIVRERAAMAIARRKDVAIPAIIALLDSPSLDSRVGACQAIAHLKGRAAPAVPKLRDTLGADDLWLRIKAAEAIAAIGRPAMPAAPALLEMLAKEPAASDPRGMERRFLCFALFDRRTGLLGQSLEGVDRGQLASAVRVGLVNQDGRARGSLSSVYDKLTFDEIRPLLPAIYEAILTPAQSGEMFAEDIRVAGLRLLARHHVEEGIEACINYARTQNPWASQNRTKEVMKILAGYGASARPAVPALEKMAAGFDAGEPDFPLKLSQEKAVAVREAIRGIEASTDKPDLIPLPR